MCVNFTYAQPKDKHVEEENLLINYVNFNDIGCYFEAEPPTDSLNNGEISTWNGAERNIVAVVNSLQLIEAYCAFQIPI